MISSLAMQVMNRNVLVVVVSLSVAAMWGCGKKDKNKSGAKAPAPAKATDKTPDTKPAPGPTKPATTGVVLTGTIIKKPWSKSTESWNAGGSEYYVLDVGGAKVEKKSAKEGVTLIATDAVPMAKLAAAAGTRVSVRGEYVDAKPYTPKQPTEQYPTGMGGKPLPRGAGFRALSIDPAK